MPPDPCAGLLVTLLFLLAGLKLLLGPVRGCGHGFWAGFWAAFWGRILEGPRSPGAASPFGCLVIVLLLLLVLFVIGLLGSLGV
jgi:hypothetical protein